MRDEKDPGTIEMPLSRRRGRPTKHGEAMSPAERMRNYRLSRRHAAMASYGAEKWRELSDAALVDALRIAMGEVDRRAVRTITRIIQERYCNS